MNIYGFKTLITIGFIICLGYVSYYFLNASQSVRYSFITQDVKAYEETPTKQITVSASWYGQEYCDKYSPACIAADGSRFIDGNYTAACDKRWKLGTYLKISYKTKTLVVKCTDRGNFKKYGRDLDLSKGSFRYLESLSKGVIKVRVEEVK